MVTKGEIKRKGTTVMLRRSIQYPKEILRKGDIPCVSMCGNATDVHCHRQKKKKKKKHPRRFLRV